MQNMADATPKKRGRPRNEPGEPAKTLIPKLEREQKIGRTGRTERSERPRVWALPEEAIRIEAERIVQHRAAGRARYKRVRQSVREAFPHLLKQKADTQQSNTLDDYRRYTVPIVGTAGSTERHSLPESTEGQGDQSA